MNNTDDINNLDDILSMSDEDFEKYYFKCKVYEIENPLLKDWKWICYNDGSGHLKSPTNIRYFSYDWETKEYKKIQGAYYGVWQDKDNNGNELTFKDFQKFAENYVIRNYVKLPENILKESLNNDEKDR